MTQRRARARTWTLAALDRDQAYLLRFNLRANRWDLALLDAPAAPIVTRAPAPERTASQARSAEHGPPDAATTSDAAPAG